MSLPQERNSSTVFLVLSILEGHGFGFLQTPVVIVASACGIFLDTEVVPPSPDPVFHIDLVWETNKKSLRRFRASNTPVKIECFAVGPNNKRDCIGSILLNIKSAQVVSCDSNAKVIERWYKLIGVPPGAKTIQPELLLSLKIQETVSMPHHPSQSLQPKCDTMKEKSIFSTNILSSERETATQKSSLTHPQVCDVPMYNDLEQYIQIGERNSSQNMFALTLHIGNMTGIRMLLSEREMCNINQGFQVSFTIMSQNFSTKVFDCNEVDKIFPVDQDLVIHVRSTLQVLYFYLHENPSVSVHLFLGEEEIAAAELHLRSLVPTNSIQSFSHEFDGEISCTQRCLWVSSHSGSIPIQDGIQPCVEVTSKLQLVNNALPQKVIPSKVHEAIPISTTHQAQERVPSVTAVREDIPSRSDSRQSQETFILTTECGPKWIPVIPNSIEAMSSVSNKKSHIDMEKNNINQINQMHTLFIKLNKLQFKHPHKCCHLRIMFECSQKPILTSDLSDILIQNDLSPVVLCGIHARIVLPSLNQLEKIHTVDVVFSEVLTDPTISQPFALASVQVNLMNLLLKKEFPFMVPLRHAASMQDVGLLYGTLLLEELDFTNSTENIASHCGNPQIEGASNYSQLCGHPAMWKKDKIHTAQNLGAFSAVEADSLSTGNFSRALHTQSNDLLVSAPMQPCPTSVETQPLPTMIHPPHMNSSNSLHGQLDTDTATRIVEELEDWKEKQQELFQAELKRRECDHLSQVCEELTIKKKELESILGSKIVECKNLLHSLSNAREDLRSRLAKCQQREQELKKEKEELEFHYNQKFQELILTAKKLDEGAKLKVSSSERKCSELEKRLNALALENESLLKQLHQNQLTANSHGDSHTCGMNHIQVTKLLSQVNQLEEKLQSSIQSKAHFKEQWGRAVRKINQTRSQLSQNSKDYGMDEILGEEEAELQHDKQALEELRKQLASYNSGP